MPFSNVKLGANVRIWHPNTSNLYGCDIGDDCTIGALVEIQKGVVVGKGCTISSHSFLCEGVTLGHRVFVGHGVMFCNEKHPQAGRAVPWKLAEHQKILVGDGAVIGSNATILPGVWIGTGATVGAGSVVTKSVPPGVTVMGNPARSAESNQEQVCDLVVHIPPAKEYTVRLRIKSIEKATPHVGRCCGDNLDERIEAYCVRELKRIVK